MRTCHLLISAGLAASFAAAAPARACELGTKIQPASWQDDRPNRNRDRGGDGIVGMWTVQFLVNGSQFDFGYQQWHSDGTEVLNSGSRPPSTQNFCLGVWQQVGGRYKLNHYALSYDAAGKLNGRVNIREDVGLDPNANQYAGSFTIDVIEPTRNTVLQHVAGRVTGRRITIGSGMVP